MCYDNLGDIDFYFFFRRFFFLFFLRKLVDKFYVFLYWRRLVVEGKNNLFVREFVCLILFF